MRRICLLFFVFFIAFIQAANPQQKRLDSLLVLNNSYHKEDSLKAIYLKDIFRAYASQKNYPEYKLYADSAVKIAAALPRKNVLAYIYQRIAAINHVSDRLEAITNYRKSIEAAKISGATKTEAGSYLNLGALYMSIRDYPSSLDAHERALTLYVFLGEQVDVTSCYMNIATIYNGMQQRVKAIEYARKAMPTFETLKSYRGIAVACDVLGATYLSATEQELDEVGVSPSGRLRVAADIFEKGLKAAKQANDNGVIASVLADFGRLNEMMGKNDIALSYFLKALEISKDEDDNDGQEIYLDNLVQTGVFYLKKMKDTEKAGPILFHALVFSQKIKNLAAEQDVLTALSNMHEGNRNFDSALYYFRKSMVVRDSISGEEREKEITRKQLKIDFEIKERGYRETQQLTDVKLKQQVLLAREREQELLVKKQQLELSDKEKSLQRLTFLQKQAELENQKKSQANQLVQEHLKAEYDRKILDKQIDVQHVELVSNGRLIAFLGVGAVIVLTAAVFIYKSRTKTVKLNRLVFEQKTELEELVKVKDKIFSIVSHDMRAPINNLVAFGSLLEEGEIGQQKLAKYIEQVKGTLDHTSSMMENLLNWSASQMQGFTPVLENVSLNKVASNVIEGIRPALLKKNIVLDNQLYKEIKVTGDRNMTELIIRNLLSNAVKFSRQGGALAISVQHHEAGSISFSVKDNGVGLSPEKVALINASTVRSMKSTHGTDKEKGTGLGLMLCKHFAALMHGNISVKSEEGIGSVFSVNLPSG